ncbi:UNVERIFIED_CONTAM: hypothetical protein Slati_3257700 [Sesamum latifolium]|uniref:Uncharacterized protein n=1 Tax=Sesamum latifolium TaxID=2727402 RepID=A0AAW2UZL0_9LAMI
MAQNIPQLAKSKHHHRQQQQNPSHFHRHQREWTSPHHPPKSNHFLEVPFPAATANTTLPPPPPPRSDWTPADDGIEVSLPLGSTEEKNPSKQDVDAYIEKALYGTKPRKRLPVFVEICPDELLD